MTEGADKGEILKQEIFPISEGETAFSLNMKCFEKSTQSFSELVDELGSKTFKRIPQDLTKRTFYPLWKRPLAACTSDFRKPAEEICALFRALDYGTYPNRLGLPKIYIGNQVIIAQKIEKVKELIAYDELNLSEIAFRLNYSSVAHLSSQFKKVTGFTPSQFRQMHSRPRKPLDEVK